jgi:hypothetical protein
MTLSATRGELSRDTPDATELLIKEARRAKRLRRLRNFAIVIAVLAVAVVISAVQSTSNPPTKPSPKSVVAKFIESMRHANSTRFAATYRIRHYDWMGSGVITMAQIPSPPGTRGKPNSDGYSASGQYAYVFRNADGRVSQWIKVGSNVSGCVMPPKGPIGPMKCSRPSPYLPSNGFALADVGFVPTYVIQRMQNFAPKGLVNNLHFTNRTSKAFGRLTCLTQTFTTTVQSTCIDQSGYVVLWKYHDPLWSSSATLTAFNRHPTAGDFRTLVKPTQPLVLPGL